MLGPSALSSLETAGDNHRCLGRTARPAEDLGHGSAGGLWTPGLLVEAGITAQMLRRQARQAGPGHPSQDNATDGCRERKMCPIRPHPGQLVIAHCPSETHTGPVGLKGDQLWAPTEGGGQGP